jgi:hypothetical protein
LVTSRYATETTSRKSSSVTDIADPAPKFQVMNELS